MNIVIAGKNSIAVDTLKYILELKKISVFVILNRTEDFSNTFQKSLGFYARLWQVPILELEDAYKLEDTIFLSLEFDRIIKPKLFKSKQLFNIHFSKLPAYKGMFTSAMPILNGEKISGVTLHLIDEGIDTGDIIEQYEFELEINETARTLYQKYIEKGTNLVINNLKKIIEADYKPYPQEVHNSSYYGRNMIDYSNINIDFRKTAYQVDKQLRAFTFREYQLPKVNGKKINSWEISSHKSKNRPGFLLKIDNYNFSVSTIDYDMKLSTDSYDDLWKYCRSNDIKSLKRLIKSRPLDLEVKTKEGWTALIIAVYNGAYESADFLLGQGADVDASNYNRTTVLMYAKTNAIKTRDFRILNLLLSFDINIMFKDIYDKTVIDWAKEEDIEIYNLLKNRI